MRGQYLGDFEHLVLLAIIRQAGGAYGLGIRDEICNRTDRMVSTGAVYTTLDRLEQKGLVRSSVEPGDTNRDGRRRRLYEITRAGTRAVKETQEGIRRMSAGLVLSRSKG